MILPLREVRGVFTPENIIQKPIKYPSRESNKVVLPLPPPKGGFINSVHKFKLESILKTGIIILAAGSSSRLGEPKQQVLFKGKTLLQNAIETAQKTACKPVIVVLGANAEKIQSTIQNPEIIITQNSDWQQGMGSSIRVGLQQLLQTDAEINNVILLVCDQPFVTSELLKKLIATKAETGKKIVVCTYAETIGTPVLFDKMYFPELMNLQGQDGAKKLLKKFETEVATILFPFGEIDIDTPEEYAALQNL